MYQNVTLKLDKSLLFKAKVAATQKKSSLSGLMVEALKSFLNQQGTYESAQKKAMNKLRKGYKLGGGSYYSSRDMLHDRVKS